MEKRIFTMILVVALGIVIGVGIAVKEAEKPLLSKLIQQQENLLRSQHNIEKLISSGQIANSGQDTNLVHVYSKIQDLEKRMAQLEDQLRHADTAQPPVIPQGPPPEDFTKVYDIPIDHTPVIGKTDAPVTITEFVDFQCPFCSRFHPPIQQVLKAYPDKVNYVLKNYPLPFHPQARPASKAALAAAQQGKYEEFVDTLLNNNTDLSDERFKQVAKDLGMNVDKFMKDYKENDSQWEDYINKDIELGNNVGVRGTPTFYINGRQTVARDFASFQKEIDTILNTE